MRCIWSVLPQRKVLALVHFRRKYKFLVSFGDSLSGHLKSIKFCAIQRSYRINQNEHLILPAQIKQPIKTNSRQYINIKNVQYFFVILKTFDRNENILQWYLILNRHFCTNAAWA